MKKTCTSPSTQDVQRKNLYVLQNSRICAIINKKRRRRMRVYIEIGNVCNLSCSFCPRITREKRQMNEGEFRRVMTECAPVASEIYFHLMGEPLLHPMLDTFLSIAEEFGIPVCITCNGTLLSKKGYILLQHIRQYKQKAFVFSSLTRRIVKKCLLFWWFLRVEAEYILF